MGMHAWWRLAWPIWACMLAATMVRHQSSYMHFLSGALLGNQLLEVDNGLDPVTIMACQRLQLARDRLDGQLCRMTVICIESRLPCHTMAWYVWGQEPWLYNILHI